MKNKVFTATSLDGFIAGAGGNIEFLETFPAPDGDDMGYAAFMQSVDAILMGRNTFETVLGFGIPWPFEKHVFVWSTTLQQISTELQDKVTLVKGTTVDVIAFINTAGYSSLYIDGGKAIQSFIKEDLIHEMTLTTIPVLIGEGIPLFSGEKGLKKFQCIKTKLYPNGVVQSTYEKI